MWFLVWFGFFVQLDKLLFTRCMKRVNEEPQCSGICLSESVRSVFCSAADISTFNHTNSIREEGKMQFAAVSKEKPVILVSDMTLAKNILLSFLITPSTYTLKPEAYCSCVISWVSPKACWVMWKMLSEADEVWRKGGNTPNPRKYGFRKNWQYITTSQKVALRAEWVAFQSNHYIT